MKVEYPFVSISRRHSLSVPGRQQGGVVSGPQGMSLYDSGIDTDYGIMVTYNCSEM